LASRSQLALMDTLSLPAGLQETGRAGNMPQGAVVRAAAVLVRLPAAALFHQEQ
jgi:hypothetical protein